MTPYIPSPIRVRSFELLRSLAESGIRPALVCPDHGENTAHLAELRRWGLEVHSVPVNRVHRLAATLSGAAQGLPLQAAYGAVAPLQRTLTALVASGSYDAVHVEHLRAAALLPSIGHLPVVYDAVDCISLLLERTRAKGPNRRSRLLAGIEQARTAAFERDTCAKARTTIVTSPEDAAALHRLAPDADVRVVPNGVDLQRFQPGAWPRPGCSVVFSGKMSYHANIAAVQRLVGRIMPLVWQRMPDAQLTIVGSDPPAEIRGYAVDTRIEVTGRVPSVSAYVGRATVAASPLCYGVGIQNKVLEAMATATPVVADRQSASALRAREGRDLLLADDDAAFADALVRLLADHTLARQLGEAGRAYVERSHRWSDSASLLRDVYAHALWPSAPRKPGAHRPMRP